MKQDKYLKYRKYETLTLLLLFLGSILIGFTGVSLLIFVNKWFSIITIILLIIGNSTLVIHLEKKSTKYMLECYEKGDDPYDITKHLHLF